MSDVIWVYGEVVDGAVTSTTLEMVTKAAQVGTAEAILLGPAPEGAVELLGEHGASKVYRSADPVFHEYLTLPAAAVVEALIRQHKPAAVLFASSYGGRDVAAAISASLDCGAITDVADFTLTDGTVEAKIPALGASYWNTSTLVHDDVKILLVRPKAFEPAHNPKTPVVEEVAAADGAELCKVRVKERVTAKAEGPQLDGANVIVAGGQESMSNAPYLMLKGRQGYRYGHSTIYDHMALDGLEDAYDKGKAMGVFAEDCAAKYSFTREQQDAFSLESLRRARAATEDGSFKWEITPVTVAGRKGDTVVDIDEAPTKAMPEKIPTLKPAFKKDGTVTAANSSSISDGAAAMVLMRASTAEKLGVKPLARIVAHSQHSQEPSWFTTAPVGALKNLFAKTGWKAEDVDLYEINEAFAVVTMAAMTDFKLPHDKVNIHGGATALGHPIGASGARLMTTLIGALRKTGGKRGVATLCIGGGEAVAMAIEMI